MKLILIDCDGVLLDWEGSFNKHYGDLYSESNIREFLHSGHMENLEAITGAKEAVKYLHEELGYKFHMITHSGSADEIVNRRTKNVAKVFGLAPFYKITCIDREMPKSEILKEYENQNLWWIDDFWKNVYRGVELGLRAVHFNSEKVSFAPSTDSWKELVDRIKNNNYKEN